MSLSLSIEVELSGGAELLFGNTRNIQLTLDRTSEQDTWTIRRLLKHLTENFVKERPELFVKGETVRPGILVLVNDADWELVGELDYTIENKDKIAFISTLHGG